MVWYNGTRCSDNRQHNHGRFPRIILDPERLSQMYYAGTPIRDIAASLNCSVPTVKRHLKQMIPQKLRRYKFYYSASNPVNQNIAKLYTTNHFSTSVIARMVNLCDETVRKRLQKTGIELRKRNFKNVETFHPKNLNRKENKFYAIEDLNEFNQTLIRYYCEMQSYYQIALALQIDRGTVSRRIRFLRKLHAFKTRFCKRCNNLYRFMVTEKQKNSRICGRCKITPFANPKIKIICQENHPQQNSLDLFSSSRSVRTGP